jgi:serine/threonine protein kinase
VLYSSERKTWKIGDFGLTVSGTSKNPITTNEARGTTCYRAPEIVKELSTYNNKVDIWAIGCIVYELTTERRAFTNDLDVVGWGNTDQEKTIPTDIILDNIPKQFISQIVRKCLRAEPNERPTAKSICNWLRDFLGLEANESSKLEPTSEPSSIILNDVPSGSGI